MTKKAAANIREGLAPGRTQAKTEKRESIVVMLITIAEAGCPICWLSHIIKSGWLNITAAIRAIDRQRAAGRFCL